MLYLVLPRPNPYTANNALFMRRKSQQGLYWRVWDHLWCIFLQELSEEIEDYTQRFNTEDQLEWNLVLQEVAAFVEVRLTFLLSLLQCIKMLRIVQLKSQWNTIDSLYYLHKVMTCQL